MTLHEVKPLVAEAMNRLPFVRWDRFVDWSHDDDGDNIAGVFVYGWIDRDDGRSDFVSLEYFESWGWRPEDCAATSSAARSVEIQKLLRGHADDHVDCKRVDEHFGDLVERKVVLA